MLGEILIWNFDGGEFLARWAHFLAGVAWIGLLYYFNFVQGPYFNVDASPEARSDATQKLVPRALWWFRWAAMVTFLSGLAMIGLMQETRGENFWSDFIASEANLIITGAILGTLMFLNVWLVIWPNQKITIASARAVAEGREADPRAAGAARRAFLASRTNTFFSIPMLFFMGSAAHLGFAVDPDGRVPYWILFGVLTAAFEANALFGTGGPVKRHLEKHRDTIVAGFVFAAILYVFVEVFLKAS